MLAAFFRKQAVETWNWQKRYCKIKPPDKLLPLCTHYAYAFVLRGRKAVTEKLLTQQ